MNEAPTTGTSYCYRHPNRATILRCSRCERPICTECAVLTETGYRCKECIRGQQKTFDNTTWFDYPLAFIIAGVLSFGGSLAIGFIGFFVVFLAPLGGLIIAEVVRWAVRKRRSPTLYRLAAVGAAAGSLPLLAINLLLLTGAVVGRAGLGGVLTVVWYGLYAFLVTSTTYYRLSGIQMR